MADLTLSAANIRPLIGSVVKEGVAGGAVTIGDEVYLDANAEWQRTDSDAAGTATGLGIVVATASGETTVAADAGIEVCTFGPVAGFSGLTPGAFGFTSANAGKIAETAGTVTWRLGYCFDVTVFYVAPGISAPTS